MRQSSQGNPATSAEEGRWVRAPVLFMQTIYTLHINIQFLVGVEGRKRPRLQSLEGPRKVS